MKFQNFYNLVCNSPTLNEADAMEDAKELAADPALTTNTPFADKPIAQPMQSVQPMMFTTMTNDDKIDYLMKNSTIVNKPNKTEEEKRAIAAHMVANNLFDQEMFDDMEARNLAKLEEPEAGGALEELPPELEADIPTPEDIEDVNPAMRSHRRLGELESEDELEGRPD